MAYDFTKSDGTPISVADNTINTDLSIDLVGKNVSGYGLSIARNFVHMLEHFANSSAPSDPIRGQLWYDTSVSILKVYDGANWDSLVHKDSTTNNYVFHGDLMPGVDCAGSTGYDIGSPSFTWCNVYADIFHGTATQARYADLAERYEADAVYEPGTVIKIGGSKEITQTVTDADPDVFGVISRNPAILMNSEAGQDATHPPVALIGRVEVKVVGKVSKGQRLVSSDEPGVARGAVLESDSAVIGRALEDKESNEIGLILAAVGAK